MVFLWYQMTQNFYRYYILFKKKKYKKKENQILNLLKNVFRCSFSDIRLNQIDKILYRGNKVLILSQGDVYKGKCQQVPLPPYYDSSESGSSKDLGNIWSRSDHRSAEMAKDFMIRIDLQRIIQIDRAVDVFCDDDFASFAVLQESHVKYFKLPTLNPEEYTFKKLYNDVCDYDAIHDVLFHVDGEKFPAHKFIVYARAPGLRELLLAANEDKSVHLNFELLTSKMFELILKFIYCNYLPNGEG